MKKFSILTATYNRATTLPKLYASLCRQEFIDFEWVIVDDGSLDDTEHVVGKWIKDSKVEIKYFKQSNGGKHRALNAGMKLIDSEWVAIIDSDDYITDDCLDRAAYYIKDLSLDADGSIAGLIFLSQTADGEVVGDSFPFDIYKGKTYEYYGRYRIKGDKFDFYKTSVLKKFPFPEFEKEKFIAEGVVWNRINKKYNCWFVNEAHQVVEYQEGGLSWNSIKLRSESPNGAVTLYAEGIDLNVSLVAKLKYASNYFRFIFHGGKSILLDKFSCILIAGVLVGALLYVKDKFYLSRHSK